MPYEILEKQIKSLPENAVLEVMHYVGYLASLYSQQEKNKSESITDKINNFLVKNPTAFDEFMPMQNASLGAIRELTKNDTW